jgi:hypothetical protein
MNVWILIIFFGVVFIEALVLSSDVEPIRPQKMEWQYEQKVDENGIGVYDENNCPIMEKKWVPKKFDPETDSLLEGSYLRNYVYFGLSVLCFIILRTKGYFIFTGGVLWMVTNGYLPKNIPGTYQVVWGMFWLPIVMGVYCLYAVYQTAKGR